jgi:hypothetical protein
VARDGTSATLTDLYLVPGQHWLLVRARDGDYAVQVRPLGPPDPDAEREPNDAPERAEAYRIGQRRVGRLATSTDRDLFRFTVAASERIVLRLAQPKDARTAMTLVSGDERLGEIRDRQAGEALAWDLFLLPGDHVLELRPEQASQGRYELTSERVGPWDPVGDQEPNDAPGFARPVPASLSWTGTAVRPGDEDWYVLPPLDRAAPLRVRLDGGEAWARLQHPDGSRVELLRQEDGSHLAPEAPPGVPLHLVISSKGEHAVSLESDALRAVPEPGGLPVTLELAAEAAVVAAYWPEAQVVPARAVVRNDGPDDLELALETRTSHFLWEAQPGDDGVSVPAGASVEVGVDVLVRPDAWGDEPVRVSLRAWAPDGREATASMDLMASADPPPVGSVPGWGLPPELLGGLNVAATALGAAPHGTIDVERELHLYDGVTPSGGGFALSLQELPVELGVDLASDEPLPIVGTVINPSGRAGRLGERPHAFELLLSLDGETWTTVLRGELSTLPIDQAFVLDEPVLARHARLRVLDLHGDRGSLLVLGEWKVIARPGAVPLAEPVDIAAGVRGGHVVTMQPFTSSRRSLEGMLDGEPRREEVRLREGERFEVTLGFQDARAAQVTGLDWRDPDGSDPGRRMERVEVAVSLEGPIGPWQALGSWALTRRADGSVSPLSLPAPTWARYVRIRGDVATEAVSVELPATVSVLERATDDTYRSILAEWGTASRQGPYEWLEGAPALELHDGSDAGDDPESATPLRPGTVVTGRVALGEDEDWYAIAIPPGHNTLELTLSGQPTVGAKLALHDEHGAARPMAFQPAERGDVRYQATVEPGTTVLVRVTQPPFSAVFAFDTSGSMGPFLDFVLEGVRSFAAGVRPGREAVMLLPFEEPPILDAWHNDPILLQAAVGAWAVQADSSAAEQGLIDAAGLLQEREGARAILLVTDAETSSYDRTPELWQALAAVRPMVFSVHVGGSSDPVVSRQLMQAWAASGGGHYTYPTTHGEMVRAFDRMATWLRRPALYSLRATTSEVVLEPGSVAVRPPPDGSRPAFAEDLGVAIILDTSGSMLERIGGQRRIDVAKRSLERLVTEALDEGVPVSLRTFGGRGRGRAARCQTRLPVPLAPLDRAAMLDRIGRLRAVRQTRTPIGASLEAVAGDLEGVTGPRIVLLVTDGAETCQGDPAAAIAGLREGGLDVNVNIVGFALDDEELKETMRSWAEAGGGSYFDAAGADDLAESIQAAVNAPFRVLAPDGTVVAGGTVGGSPVALDPGAYRVEVLIDPPVTYREVVVGSGADVALVLPAPGEEP